MEPARLSSCALGRLVDDVMWPLGVISEKLFKMAGDDGVQEEAGSPSPDGQIPLARRSYYVDVSLTYSRRSIIHLTVRFLTFCVGSALLSLLF